MLDIIPIFIFTDPLTDTPVTTGRGFGRLKKSPARSQISLKPGTNQLFSKTLFIDILAQDSAHKKKKNEIARCLISIYKEQNITEKRMLYTLSKEIKQMLYISKF